MLFILAKHTWSRNSHGDTILFIISYIKTLYNEPKNSNKSSNPEITNISKERF